MTIKQCVVFVNSDVCCVVIYILYNIRTVMLYAGLYELWKTGRYKSYPPNTLVDLIARILALVPPWTRVYRVQR